MLRASRLLPVASNYLLSFQLKGSVHVEKRRQLEETFANFSSAPSGIYNQIPWRIQIVRTTLVIGEIGIIVEILKYILEWVITGAHLIDYKDSSKCNSNDLIGLASMVYEPLYHAQETETIKLSSNCSCKAKSARSSNIS